MSTHCIIALALHLGLRRAEIFRLDSRCVHHDNHGVVVADPSGSFHDKCRQVPLTDAARHAVHEWIACRHFLNAYHLGPWLNLQAGRTRADPMTRHTFDKVLLTYVGAGWTLKRLRDPCAAGWVRSKMPLEYLRQLLGLSRIEDTLPYAKLVRGSLDGLMEKLDAVFTDLVQPADLAA